MDWSKIVDWLLSGALIIWFFKWQTNQINMRKLFAETVSKSRMEWITSFRDEIGTIVAAIKMRNYVLEGNCVNSEKGKAKCSDCEECRKKYYTEIVPNALKAVSTLRTRLNMDITKKGNEYHGILDDMLRGIDFYEKKKNDVSEGDLISITRKILEPEWGRVKDEARGVYKH
ncbi:MAG: hypothetical protein ACI3U2_02975 [Anaerovibrio sp.]